MFEYMTLRLWLYGIIIPFVVGFFIVAWIHPLIVKMSKQRHVVDMPDHRKLQRDPVPVLGGMAVYFGIIVGIGVVSMIFNSYALFSCAVAMTVMVYLGTLDDLLGLSPTLRLALEILTVAFVVKMDMVNINDFHGLFGIGKLPVFVSLPLCVVSCVGIINSINMIDGVNGLSSGLCFVACLAFGIVFCSSFDGTMAVLASLSAGALLPFFFHNVFGQKSKMFIGDSGTLMMGMLMAIFCMRAIDNTSLVAVNHPRIGVIAFCLSVLSVPVFDTLRVMTARICRRESPFHADKSHLHHLFIEIGFSHIGTTLMVIGLNLFNMLCWFVTYMLGGNATVQFMVVVVTGLTITVGVYYTVRAMNHERICYRILKYLAKISHQETGRQFIAVRRLVDKF